MGAEIIWREIDVSPKYQVSNTGLVRNIKTGRDLSPNIDGRK